jgi:hypothetical protein
MATDLAERLTDSYGELSEYAEIARESIRLLQACPRQTVAATQQGRSHYQLWSVKYRRREHLLRPVNTQLFLDDEKDFDAGMETVNALFADLAARRGPTPRLLRKHEDTITGQAIGKVFYTLQQAYGMACDVLLAGNTARKHVGMKFETLMSVTFDALGLANTHIVFNVEGYRAEIDHVVSGKSAVRSTSSQIDAEELLVSVKTSSKDRMPKIFIDRMLLENVLGRPVKEIAIFHNDIQRKGDQGIATTFVPHLFLVYSRHLRPLDGVYFVDPPPHIDSEAWSPYLKRFDQLLLSDIWSLLR